MERMRLTPGKDEDLGNLIVIHKLILPHQKESEEVKSKQNESSKKLGPGSCITLASGGGERSCDGPSCGRIQFFRRKNLATWFSDITILYYILRRRKVRKSCIIMLSRKMSTF